MSIESILQIITICLTSLLSLIAIVVSIISIKKQTKSQNINGSIQLFDKRFEIYVFTVDLFYIVGYFDGTLDRKNKPHYFNEILALYKHIELDNDIKTRIDYAYKNIHKFSIMQKCLFDGETREYFNELFNAFSIYIEALYTGVVADKTETEAAYKKLYGLLKTSKERLSQLYEFITLSDIKRKDLN